MHCASDQVTSRLRHLWRLLRGKLPAGGSDSESGCRLPFDGFLNEYVMVVMMKLQGTTGLTGQISASSTTLKISILVKSRLISDVRACDA